MGLSPPIAQPALASLTSTQNTVREGANVVLSDVSPGTLVALCHANVKTSSVVATFTGQVSVDGGTTWFDLPGAKATASGTGSDVDTNVVIDMAAATGMLGRITAVLTGAGTNADDTTDAVYHYLAYGDVAGG